MYYENVFSKKIGCEKCFPRTMDSPVGLQVATLKVMMQITMVVMLVERMVATTMAFVVE